MFRQVLVPIDGAPGAERVVPVAAALAGRLDAGLLLWGVAHPGTDRAAQESRLYELLRRYAGGHGAYMSAGHADPVQAIVEHADNHAGTLVCAISHGQGSIGERAIGSLTGDLLQRSRSPMLVIGPRFDDSHWSPYEWRHVLACVDGSDRGERAVPIAADFARSAGLELTVMQAVCTEDDLFDRDRAERYVHALAGLHRPPAHGRVLSGTQRPAEAICAEAARTPGAVLAVASRGRGGPGHATESNEPPGSVTNDVLRFSRGAVLVVPLAASLALPGRW
ncbi:MAG: universal stress protein [Acidimicrobiales bacterium]|nr:universal stress protein [Acidimicrobiales bacterium]